MKKKPMKKKSSRSRKNKKKNKNLKVSFKNTTLDMQTEVVSEELTSVSDRLRYIIRQDRNLVNR